MTRKLFEVSDAIKLISMLKMIISCHDKVERLFISNFITLIVVIHELDGAKGYKKEADSVIY